MNCICCRCCCDGDRIRVFNVRSTTAPSLFKAAAAEATTNQTKYEYKTCNAAEWCREYKIIYTVVSDWTPRISQGPTFVIGAATAGRTVFIQLIVRHQVTNNGGQTMSKVTTKTEIVLNFTFKDESLADFGFSDQHSSRVAPNRWAIFVRSRLELGNFAIFTSGSNILT